LSRRPLMALVTSRRRLAPEGGGTDLVEKQIASAVGAGVDFIQIREPNLPDRVLFDLVSRAVGVARGTGSLVLVNDRFDVALAAGAAGVHLRTSSAPAPVIRRHLPGGFLLGRSVHGAGEAVRVAVEGGVDYLIMGTVFASASKPGQAACGVDALAATTRAVRLPVLAIGGVTVDNVREALDAGAAGVAAIGLFADPGPAGQFHAISSVVAEIRRCSEKH
jgi:thiamine-phosphate diphosphorylase